MVHEDINMNVVIDNEETRCIDPNMIMQYGTGINNISGASGTNATSPYIYQGSSMYGTMQQADAMTNGIYMNLPAPSNMGPSYVEPYTAPTIIQCKLYFLIAAHKVVQTGKEFVAVARITRGNENPFVDAQGIAYHYIPEKKHPQFNTSTPLSERELSGAACDNRAFAVHKTIGTSCAPAGTYLIYRLNRFEPGIRNLRFEAFWNWGDGFVGKASYDFVFLTAHDHYNMKPYTALQKKLLNELWPEWELHINS
ncbi:hypothetical protein F4803DRAFT_548250 [Xylaria telfairii]|nr:hypothetical protein F4803DRAFT_548250 [Xylaria telfairii]